VRASYRELLSGVEARTPYVLVRRGPVKLVDYAANGQRLEPAACGDDLVLGPLSAGARLSVSEARMNWLNLVRGVGFFVALALMVWAIPFRMFAPRALVPASIR
jgi:hypothetical protein